MKIIEDIVISNSDIGDYSWIRVGSEIYDSDIGQDVFIGFKCRIVNTTIENNVQIASGCVFGKKGSERVTIRKGSWLGADVVVKAGVTIGIGAVIGAGTIVEHDIKPFEIVIGKPGKVLKKRICEEDEYPQFRSMLKRYSKLCINSDNNYISADLELDKTSVLGNGNIVVGKKALGGGVFVEKGVVIGNDNILEGAGGISIGAYSRIGNGVHMISNSHDYKKLSLPMVLQPIKIGKNVFIGDGCIILGNVQISDNKTIPENSLVLKNV